MKFLKKLDHIKLLQFALGIAIFSIGYLITMFYFQMLDLKEYKYQSEVFNDARLTILQLKSDVEIDNYSFKNHILNQNFEVNKAILNPLLGSNFFTKTTEINKIDSNCSTKNNEIKTLINNYLNIKNQLITLKLFNDLEEYNFSFELLKKQIQVQSNYLENQIKILNLNYLDLIHRSRTSGFLIALISLVIFVLAYVRMNEDLFYLQKTNDEIMFANLALNNAEMIAGFGSWKLNIIENKFTFSDNFYRLLNEKPNSFEASLDKIMEYVHPDDREEVIKAHKDSFKNQEPTNIMYRYLLPDGTVKHIITIGKFLQNSKGDLVKIGVNQDVTELIKKNKELEEKNSRLISINSELESFSNIVGHDLQEPLRKIQMFISRIESKEFLENSSEATINYFTKIKSVAQRMHNLMTDLVNYTRTVKGDRIFEQVDLNTIFVEIMEELSLTVEEKKAKITIDDLPTILGTRFQIQQLFINLISNSLKYVKPDVKPIIQIRLVRFENEIVNERLISENDYYKITVSDNGIGFEQKYADKIFLLFKRLETDQSYKGTGLGLAICKKIVDNNNGLITAIGIPNEGSVFSVYLPKRTNFN